MTTAREFARRGLAIGPSSGLNIAAARRLAERLGPGHHVGTILPDRMERYFSTALFDDVAAELYVGQPTESDAELSLRQDLDEVLDPEHLLQDVSREQGGIDRVLRAVGGRRPDLVVDEVGHVDARVHPGVDAVA